MTGPHPTEPSSATGVPGLWTLIREDYRSHNRDWTLPGFRTLAVYRFGVWRMGVRFLPLRALFRIAYRAMFRHCRNVYGIELPYTARIGRGVIIEHQGGIVIHGNTVIGDNTIIRQGCTFGVRRIDRPGEAPVVGCNVNIGAGAALLGAIHVGDNAAIGANAVVLHDVPAGALVVGMPARVVECGNRAPHAK
ncbi:serine O-acetyltransferase [Sphingobium subterraneum]|uniref:Serine O-acetyltransferase n=1 Tax=Sphingobium subterraneum TaxID=627688 RepID=A0A841J1S1_9SPHN|nr:serine acetyltransferase [Sphingobium subterraneum]MBB6122488.1 serine O-acetyltransferase [Sphingobium subterraneum]